MRRGPHASAPPVTVVVDEGIAWLTLGRSTLDHELLGALTDACESVEHDERVRVAVVAGAGADFCVGLPRGVTWPPDAWPDGIAAVAGLTKPVIGCLRGAVRGWGVALV